MRYSITEDSNTHDRFAVALSAPGVGVIGHVPREYLASILVWCDTFCSTEGRLLAKFLGEDNVAKAWKCRVTTPVRAVPLSIDPDIAPFSSSACAVLKTRRRGKDRKKGCTYDPGVLMIQGALQNQTLRYHVRVLVWNIHKIECTNFFDIETSSTSWPDFIAVSYFRTPSAS